jgi:CHASE2 domain-containing sensor protein
MKNRPELFEILLSPIEGDSTKFKVVATQSSSGEGTVESVLPFFEGSTDRRTTLLRTLEVDKFNSEYFDEAEQNWLIKVGLLLPDRKNFCSTLAETVGNILYKSLFPAGSLPEKLLDRAIQIAKGNKSKLLIQLKFEPHSVQVARLPDYPWELIHDGDGFLLHNQTSLSRYIAFASTPPKFPPVEKINVLLISSSASDDGLDIQKLPQTERLAVGRSLKNAIQGGRVNLEVLQKPTIDGLAEYLTQHTGKASPHILHFDGHGLFGKQCRNCGTLHRGIKSTNCHPKCLASLPEAEGYLIFENDDGSVNPVSASQLGTLLQEHQQSDGNAFNEGVAVVVLSACQSGMAVEGESVFRGTAQNLIYHGIPAVVAMQYSVRVEEAVRFAEHFYRSIGEKNSLAVAVGLGRTMMGVDGNQWYRPVLYLRWQDNYGGQLFPHSEIREKESRGILSPSLSSFQYRIIVLIASTILSTLATFALQFSGLLKKSELVAYDVLSQLQVMEKDDRILIVTISNEDLYEQEIRGWKNNNKSLSDQGLSAIISKIDEIKPKIIGLDIYDREDMSNDLKTKLENDERFISICKLPNDYEPAGVKSIFDPDSEIAGFSNVFGDDKADKVIRRNTLTQKVTHIESSCRPKFSFSALIASNYFSETANDSNGLEFDKDNTSAKLNGKHINRIINLPGIYDNDDTEGFQILLRYRSRAQKKAFESISLSDLLKSHSSLKEKYPNVSIVLIGSLISQFGDTDHPTPYGYEAGVFIQAEMVSQLISLPTRPLIWHLDKAISTIWVTIWALVGSGFVLFFVSHRRRLFFGVILLGIIFIIWVGAFTLTSCWLLLVSPTINCTFAQLIAASVKFVSIHRKDGRLSILWQS